MNLPKNNKAIINYPVVLFLMAELIMLLLLPLFQKGTFIDGQLYKTVAFNDAIHAGGFWSMKYTDTCMPVFCEQPPLYPFLLGIFYKWFGSYYLVDRFFTLALLALFIFVVRSTLQLLFKAPGFYYRLFIFLMLSVPIWCWSYANQVIEPLVCVFTAAGIYSFVKYLKSKTLIPVFAFAILVYLSFLTKGFQSCFLLMLPMAYFFTSGFKKPVFYFVLFSALLTGLALVLTIGIYAPAREWFQCYYNARLILTMKNIGGTTDDHSEIIVRFFTELVIPLGILLILLAWLVVKKKYPLKYIFKNFIANKLAVAFLITALAGSFPYAISLVQRGFYLVPSFVCFLLAVVSGFARYWLFFAAAMQRLFNYKLIKVLTVVIFTGSLACFMFTCNSYKRDEELLTDIDKMLPYLKQKDTVLIKGDLWNYFNLHSYLYMAKRLSLIDDEQPRGFLILSQAQANTDSAYTRLNTGTKALDLFVRKKK